MPLHSGHFGVNRGEAFEYYALKEPHSRIVLSPEKKQRALANKEFRRELEDELFKDLKLSAEARIQSLKVAVTRYQSPESVRSADGNFMHPKTKFAELLHDAFTERLPELFPGLEVRVAVFTAVGSLLDLYGIDGFVRAYLRDPKTGKMAGISDVTIDMSCQPKDGTRANISAIGGFKTLEEEETLRKFVDDIYAVAADLIKLPLDERSKVQNIRVFADGYDFDNRYD